jgi:RecA-family ATPase
MLTLDVRAMAHALEGDVSGRDGVVCPGPGHSRQDRSLSVRFDSSATDGFVVYSFAGDDPIICKDHVRERLGIAAFKPNGKVRAADNSAKLAASTSGISVVATYVYTERDGAPLYRVRRLASKKFIQERVDGMGGWLPGLNGQRTVPYRWPELVKYPDATVFICEGEKDADRVASLGACATTISGSAKWTEETVGALAGRDCLILEDNDETGREKALAAAHALHGQAKSVRIVRLPGLPERGDVSDWLEADTTRGIDELTAACFETPLWVQPPKGGLPFIDMSKWDAEPAPRREWAIQDCVPLRQPTIFSGEGAVGKSLLDLMRSVAHVLGKSWLGKVTEPGPAIYLGAEDEENELHRRLADILAHYDATFADAIAGGLHMLSYAGQDAVLGVPNARGTIEPTPLFKQLREAALDIRPKSITIDTVADVFAGNENDRSQVRQFVGMLRGLAIEANAALAILAHPSLSGISSGSGMSGSTAWHNSVRARAYLTHAQTEKGEEPDPDLRELIFKKNNYGPVAERILLRWECGVFVPEAGCSSLEKLAVDQRVDERFLQLLAEFTQQGRNLSDKQNANSFAPKMFAQEKGADGKKISKSAFEGAMTRLFAANKIHVETYGPPSRGWYRLALGPRLQE